MANPVDGYPGKKSATFLAGIQKSVIEDFKIGLTYYRARKVGQTGAGDPVVYTDQFVLEAVQIAATGTAGKDTLNNQLLEFQNDLAAGNAYKSTNTTTGAPTTTVGA